MTDKEERVRESRAHAALVSGGESCLGWCITCFFVDKKTRRRGVSDAALGGALAEIAKPGGGTVESYPEDAAGRKVSGCFLNNGTLSLFEHHGFERVRRLGKHHWVVRTVVG